MTSPRDELLKLVNQQVEARLDDAGEQRMAELLRDHSELVAVYTEYLCLHGQLYWDAGLCAPSLPAATLSETTVVSPSLISRTRSQTSEFAEKTNGRYLRRMMAVCAALVVVLGGWFVISQPVTPVIEVAVDDPSTEHLTSMASLEERPVAANDTAPSTDLKPLELRPPSPRNAPTESVSPMAVAETPSAIEYLPAVFEDDQVVAEIDRLLQATWDDQGVAPSEVATDSEWVRRVYLTLTGRVPTLNETQEFLVNSSPRKRQSLMAEVAGSSEQASHFAVVWTNLLVGRTKRPGVNRERLFEFLVEQFADNKPWINTVEELITATGRNDQNGATNFLLAHLNNEATPATAVTARLFLGEQVSCVQCHDHPFSRSIKQQEYWALNAFFKDTERKTVALANASNTARMADTPWRLVDLPREDRMTYFETLNGLQQAVLPAYDGKTLPRDSFINRRQELAKFLMSDSETKVARAMVNRMWGHFFGYGFTNPIDDMGPHSTVSHPKLLNLLTEAFVKSGYDLKRLTTWITGSRSWQSSSQSVAANAVDDPASGIAPLFTRVYVRRMTPEQVYESIRVAICSAAGRAPDEGKVHSRHRREWVSQFATSYGTDENDESLDFEGTIAQAMVMMNGVEVDQAIHQATKAIIHSTGQPVKSGTEALNRVALAMLTREPTSHEEAVFRKHYRRLSQQNSADTPMVAAVEDMMWAYLNSSEFVLVH